MSSQESFTLQSGLVESFQKAPVELYKNKDGSLRFTFGGPFKGLDTTSNLVSVDPAYLITANNADILEDGALSKRKGYISVLNSDWGSRTIRAGYEFTYSSALSKKIVLYGMTGAGSSGIFGYIDGAGAVQTISSSLATQKPSIIQFGDLLFVYNGTDDFVYDGTNTYQIGITPPAATPGLASNVNGSLVVGGTYSVAYTYYNSVTHAESSPSPLASLANCC
jgi:hypothetical protein